MKTIQHKKAFTLTELMVTIGIMSFIVTGILMGIIQVGRNIEKTRNYNFARKELSSFVQGIYSFVNKSYGAFFWNTTTSVQVDYLASYPAVIIPGNAIWDTLYLVKNAAATLTGTLTYNPNPVTTANPNGHTISWNPGGGAATVVLLTKVYRTDYATDASPGTAPIFKFPHQSFLYVTTTNPRFLVVEFLKRIAEPTSTNPNPINIPVKLMYQLNTQK